MGQDTKLIVLDMDGTVVDGCMWQDFNIAAGATMEEDQYYYQLYRKGAITYSGLIQAMVGICRSRGQPTRHSIARAVSNYRIFPGVRETIQAWKAKGIQVALISGSFDIAVETVAKDLGIDIYAFNSTMIFDRDNNLTGVESKGAQDRVKIEQLLAICDKLNILHSQCMCVGDGSNDRLLFILTNRGITFEHCKSLHNCCRHIVKDWEALRLLTTQE